MSMKARTERGSIHIRKLNLILAVVVVAISVVLLISTFFANKKFKEMYEGTENYITWQQSAFDLELASDYLTEQARLFVMTGNVRYMENYFEEANVTRRRDKALDSLRKAFEGTETFEKLEAAMKSSVRLMEREYYSMRLAADIYGIDTACLPVELRAVELLPADTALTKDRQLEIARSMVFDDTYRNQKSEIYEEMNACLDGLISETETAGTGSLHELRWILIREQILIVIMIIVVGSVVIITWLLLISPLLKAIWHVRTEQPLPVVGSYEFRYLAMTYNLMYESNIEKREHLVYEAMHDKLTDLYNRSGYEFLLKNIDKSSCTFLMIDLDKFKHINDTYGHDAGDKALQRAADKLKGSFRSKDYICRIGGDEFVVIMVNTGSDVEKLIFEKIDAVNESLSHPKDNTPAFTLSVGIAFGDKGHSLKDADEALYEVKSEGGGGCRAAE